MKKTIVVSLPWTIIFLFDPLVSCVLYAKQQIKHVSVTSSAPFFSPTTGEKIIQKKQVDVYYYENMVMYQFFYDFDSATDNNKRFSEIRSNYVIYTKNEAYGYKFSPPRNDDTGRVRVDSIIRRYAYGEMKFDAVLNQPVVPLSRYDSLSGRLEELYVFPGKSADSIRFYYSKEFYEFDFSFSPRLDSVKKMKLYKVELQKAPSYSEQLQQHFPASTAVFEIQKGDDKYLSEARIYFDLYKKRIRAK